ncbi:MAG: flagellar basal body P-ring formation chaperone FlgA [Pirellulaceae bacterium]
MVVIRFSIVLLVLCAVQPVWATDQIVLRFLESPHTSNTLIRLSDLVEVLSGQSPSLEKLMHMPLGPAPRVGDVQGWHSSDLLQHLQLRGVHPASVRWSGSTYVEIQRTEALDNTVVQNMTPAFVNERIVTQAEKNIAQAITEYLNLRNGERVAWRIHVRVPQQQASLLQIRRNIASIGGGTEPWPGEQQFVLQIKNQGTLMSLPIQATVEPPPMVVVSKRAIRREEVISADALAYAALPKDEDEAKYFRDIEKLVGKQARRSISTGLAIAEDFIGEPVVVVRNDLVEIESVAGGVVVRSSAKALGSGAVGDLIEIEMPSRHRLHATIVGQSQVRVSAVPARAAPTR